MKKNKTENASKLASLTFSLIISCEEKESRFADIYRLTHSEYRCLRLFIGDEHLNNKVIAKNMNKSKNQVSKIIDGLVKKDYVIRSINIKDRRTMELMLSSKGKELVEKLNDSYLDIHKNILSDIEASKHDQLINSLTLLLSSLEKWISRT